MLLPKGRGQSAPARGSARTIQRCFRAHLNLAVIADPKPHGSWQSILQPGEK